MRSIWCGPCLMPLRSTSMIPRLAISPCRRARNLRRVGLSSPKSERFGCVRLCDFEEGGEMGKVHAVFPVIALRVSAYPALRRSWTAARAIPCRPAARSQAAPVSASQMRRSSPLSLVSVVTLYALASHRDVDLHRTSPGCALSYSGSNVFDPRLRCKAKPRRAVR